MRITTTIFTIIVIMSSFANKKRALQIAISNWVTVLVPKL